MWLRFRVLIRFIARVTARIDILIKAKIGVVPQLRLRLVPQLRLRLVPQLRVGFAVGPTQVPILAYLTVWPPHKGGEEAAHHHSLRGDLGLGS